MNIKELIALADSLDKAGQHEEADRIDGLAKKLAHEDEELIKGLKEEGWSNPQVVPPESQEDKDARHDGMGKESLEQMHKQLAGSGYDVFGPGELQEWLAATGYKKSGEEGESEHGVNLQKFLDEEGMDADDLPAYQPGLMNLDSKDRLGGLLSNFMEDKSTESYESLQEALQGLMNQEEQETPGSDEDIAGQIQKHEEENDIKWASKKALFEKLAGIADRLDKMGATEEAGLVDGFIAKHADDVDWKDEADTEQSKRYDSKHHHSLQVREPKKDQERVDREGRKTNHVHTQQNVEASALSTRYCPDHVGVSTHRVGESTYQCSLDGKVYNYEAGWTDYDGKEHPGGSLAAQTPDSTGYAVPHRIFDSRENILNRINN